MGTYTRLWPTDKVLPSNRISNAVHPISAATSLTQCPFLLGVAGPFTSPPPPWSPLGSQLSAPLSSLRAPFEACLRTNPAILSVKGTSWLLITSEPNPECSLPVTKPSLCWPWPLLQPPPAWFPFSLLPSSLPPLPVFQDTLCPRPLPVYCSRRLPTSSKTWLPDLIPEASLVHFLFKEVDEPQPFIPNPVPSFLSVTQPVAFRELLSQVLRKEVLKSAMIRWLQL